MSKLNVVQAFHQYLDYTENWAYKLISNLPDTKNYIISKEYLRFNFYNPDFVFIEFPLKKIDVLGKKGFFTKVFNRLVHYSFNLYPFYVKSVLKDIKIDIFHSHFAYTGWDYIKLAKKLKAKHVVSFYGLDYENLPFREPEWEKRYRKLFKEADLFICEGNHGAKILKNMGCPEEKVVVNRLGVEVENIPFYKREKKEKSLKLVQIASFREKKGHIYTVKAFHKALKDCPNMSLTFVGKGETRKQVEEYVKKENLQDKVSFIDVIDYTQLYSFLKDFDVFIHPSCYSEDRDCEGGAPIVLLDAQATGMPVISTFHCDIPDEVLDGKTGFLAEEKDVESIASFIKKFYFMKKDEYLEFSINARGNVEKYYNIKKNAKNLYNIYRELLKDESS